MSTWLSAGSAGPFWGHWGGGGSHPDTRGQAGDGGSSPRIETCSGQGANTAPETPTGPGVRSQRREQ